MKKYLTLLFLLLVSSAFFYNCSGQKESVLRGDHVVKRTDFFITLNDGTKLDAVSFIPLSTARENGWATILYCHGFGLSKDTDTASLRSQAEFGYATFSYSMRGQGKSEGFTNVISRQDAYDLIEVVEHIKKNESVNSNRVGISGGSQGGIIPFMAASMGLNVRCLITDLATPDFASNWIENNSIKMSLLWTLNSDNRNVKFSNDAIQYREWILSGEAYKYQMLFEQFPISRDFTDIVSNCNLPMFISNAWQDKFFNTTGMIDNIGKFGVFNKLYFGTMEGHGSELNQGELRYRRKLVDEWINVWLDDIDGKEILSNLYTYAFSSFPVIDYNWSWSKSFAPVYPFEEISYNKYFFHPDGKLSITPNESTQDTISFRNTVADNFTLKEAVNLEFTGDHFRNNFSKEEIAFVTEPFETDMLMMGAPVIKLFYSSSATSMCQYNFQIFEVDALGNEKLITRANYTDIFSSPFTKKEIAFKGLAHAHKFKKGNRLKVIVTNLDNSSGDSFLRTNPYVLPVLESSTNYIFMNTFETSTSIELPVLRNY